VWQVLREELAPKGLEIVTVALDTGDADAPRACVEAAGSRHPSLIDAGHVLDELLGVVNVPTGVWIDEAGMVVRPPETAAPQEMEQQLPPRDRILPPGSPPRLLEMMEESHKIRNYSGEYVAALRDWVEHGAASRYALSPEEVVRRSQPRPREVAEAAACFELAQHLHRDGHPDAAVPWFREAHRLQPDNWTYRRQAWFFINPLGKKDDADQDWPYEGDWLSDVRKIGAENYYERMPENEP
jgi:hypothetical protein